MAGKKSKYSSKVVKKAVGGGMLGFKKTSKYGTKMGKSNNAVVKKMGGGSMDPKKYMNKGGIVKRRSGGKIKNRNMGGVIGGGLASQNVVDYLYKRDS